MTIRDLRKQAKAAGMPGFVRANRAEIENYLYGDGLDATNPAPVVEELSGDAAPNVATVCDAGGRHVRTYTLETHGQAFADLAEQFARQYDGYVVTTALVGKEQPKPKEGTVERNVVDPNAMMVLAPNGSIVRIYTQKQHGQGYADLAKQFTQDKLGYTTEPVRVT